MIDVRFPTADKYRRGEESLWDMFWPGPSANDCHVCSATHRRWGRIGDDTVCSLISWPVVFDLHNKAQLSLTNPHDAKTCQKLLQFDVKTSCRQVNDLFEVMEFGCFEVSEFGHYTACYQQYWPCAQFVGPISHVRVLQCMAASQKCMAKLKLLTRGFIDHGANWKCICNFLLVINSNFVRIFYRIGLSSVLRPLQHSIGYMGDGFYRSKDPTNSIKVLKEKAAKENNAKNINRKYTYTQNSIQITVTQTNTASPLVCNNMGWLGDSSHRGQVH